MLEDVQAIGFEAGALRLNGRERGGRMVIAPIGSEGRAIGGIDHGGDDVFPGAETGEQLLGGLAVSKRDGGGGVGADDFGKRFEIGTELRTGGDLIVGDEGERGRNEGGEDRADDDEQQLVLDGEIAVAGQHGLFPHNLGEAQELGANVQLLAARGLQIDLETDVAVFDFEIDDSPIFGEVGGFADGEDSGDRDFLEEVHHVFVFGGGDEQHLAAGGLRGVCDFADLKRAAVDGFTGERFDKRIAKGVAAKHADDDGVGGRLEGLRRPFHELREVIQERGFYFVFVRRLAGRTDAHQCSQNDGGREPEFHLLHVLGGRRGHPQSARTEIAHKFYALFGSNRIRSPFRERFCAVPGAGHRLFIPEGFYCLIEALSIKLAAPIRTLEPPREGHEWRPSGRGERVNGISSKVRWRARRRTGAMAAAALAPLRLGAQNAPADLTQMSLEDLMNVQVTSVSKKEQKLSKTAAAVFVITQEDIRRSGATNIPDLLRMAPGVDVAQVDANRWAISIRGFNTIYGDKVLVLIDGRSVYENVGSNVFWDDTLLPLEDIDRIEVIRGPGGTAWGANAVNGVINIISKSAKATKGGVISTGGGSQQTAREFAQYGGSIGQGVGP